MNYYFRFLQSTSPISCASSSSETSEEEDDEQKIKRRKNLYELKKKLEIETPVDIPDIIDEIDAAKTNENTTATTKSTSNSGMQTRKYLNI